MVNIAGGVYYEQCIFPRWDNLYGSGGRAAASIASLSKEVVLTSYLAPQDFLNLQMMADNFKFQINIIETNKTVEFFYRHGLAVPEISSLDSRQNEELIVEGDVILRFGMLEGSAKVHGRRVVYDPQSATSPQAFASNGSTADELAIVLNQREGHLLTGKSEAAEIIRHLHSEHKAAVVVLKQGSYGCLVSDGQSIISVPAFRTNQVFPIGSGDVFSATFTYYWGEKGLLPQEAALNASRSAAYYCNTASLPVPDAEELVSLNYSPIEPKRQKSNPPVVYLAAPFFTIAERTFVNETRAHLINQGLRVFSPIHDVGSGPSSFVAKADLDGLRESDMVFAIVDGKDPGTIFEIGYAIALNKPVVVLSQNEPVYSWKMLDGTGCKIFNDFVSAIYNTTWLGIEL